MKEPEDIQHAASHHEANYVDYRETDDVTRVHAAIKRENRDPETGNVPLPLWFLAVCGLAVGGAFFYLGSYSGSFSGSVYNESAGSAAVGSPAAGGDAGSEVKELTPAEKGKLVFAQACVSCHQASGMGLPGQFPSLVKASNVTGGSKRLVAILLKGLQGPLKTESGQYNGAMPAQEATMTSKNMAALLTYVRQDWGNQASPISPEQVDAARKEFASRTDPWTEAEIEAIPANAEVGTPGASAAAAPAK
jgi:mono/diheme cytochrome c family protein